MPGDIRIGTSGWVYRHWRGVFYPEKLPQTRWLSFYMERFGTVELNASFYRLPTEKAFDRWRDAAPAGFLYAVKASRFLTHIKRLIDCQEPLALFLERARRLEDRLGPVLFQLPPRMKADAARLSDFAALLPDDLVPVFEFRDDSWFTDDIRRLMTDKGLAFCIHDHRTVSCPDWVTARAIYYRFHGSTRSRHGRYGARLAEPAERMRKQLAAGHDVYVYFNNDAWGCAIADAGHLSSLLEAR